MERIKTPKEKTQPENTTDRKTKELTKHEKRKTGEKKKIGF
jgi:hypothetical protein